MPSPGWLPCCRQGNAARSPYLLVRLLVDVVQVRLQRRGLGDPPDGVHQRLQPRGHGIPRPSRRLPGFPADSPHPPRGGRRPGAARLPVPPAARRRHRAARGVAGGLRGGGGGSAMVVQRRVSQARPVALASPPGIMGNPQFYAVVAPELVFKFTPGLCCLDTIY